MQNTGNLNSLTEKLKARTEQERREVESLTRQQFNALSKSLSESSKNALNTTEAAILSGIADMEKNITSRCQSLGKMFDGKYLASILLSAGILLLATLACWGLMRLYQHRITDLRQEITALQNRKEILESNTAEIRAIFKGLEPYREKDKDYLLTPEGWKIIHAGTVGKRDAWSMVRK
jgi:ATP-dependent exoDNAse (exonuclease V) alpha subunit